jgi:hypothetical protein
LNSQIYDLESSLHFGLMPINLLLECYYILHAEIQLNNRACFLQEVISKGAVSKEAAILYAIYLHAQFRDGGSTIV